ncbi:YheU family protein [Desulfotignum phosphitoxidans]|uniref:YheU family protein n=1 Tax=Desulfotignum phosphitoxidans DSM 13687 TaxID=1286635 RepID=S0G2M6_9BACT|nr:YheU family protein [Desulfotignum phosphitoxidans]EMS78417.1 hypothetical protein Dpo_8c00840 [Desulfotignum phosphitoxidans DSM 13687]
MNKNRLASGLIIPFNELSPEALQGVIHEFVTRDGTDYGESEIPLNTKIQQVLNQLHAGKAFIVFDQKTETCNIIPSGDIKI